MARGLSGAERDKARARAFCKGCGDGQIEVSLREYLDTCAGSGRGEKRAVRVPNVAGFCRFLGISPQTYARAERLYPETMGRIRAVFEDEALNAGLPATVLVQYLRYLHEGSGVSGADEEAKPITVTFMHDILKDGG